MAFKLTDFTEVMSKQRLASARSQPSTQRPSIREDGGQRERFSLGSDPTDRTRTVARTPAEFARARSELSASDKGQRLPTSRPTDRSTSATDTKSSANDPSPPKSDRSDGSAPSDASAKTQAEPSPGPRNAATAGARAVGAKAVPKPGPGTQPTPDVVEATPSAETVPTEAAVTEEAKAAPVETEKTAAVEVAIAPNLVVTPPMLAPPTPVATTPVAPTTPPAEGEPVEKAEGIVPNAATGTATGQPAPATATAPPTSAGFAAALDAAGKDDAKAGGPSTATLAEATFSLAAPIAPEKGTTGVHGTTATPAHAATLPASPPVPLGAVPMTIGLRALGAASRFEIRLDPIELGRIDVSLDIDKDKGTVGAKLVVERPETLALLQRDSSSLQQALAQTGLDPSKGVTLSLRDGSANGFANGNGAQDGSDGRARNGRGGTDAVATEASIEAIPLRGLRALGALDIRI